MKKLLTVGVALLIASSAFAQTKVEEKKSAEFKYSVWANAFAITEDTKLKDQTKQYSEIRVRPMFTLSNENVSMVTRFEIDQFFGAKYAATTGANDVSYADPDTDEKAVEVKWAYITVKDMIVPGLTMTAGLAPYVYSVGFNNDMPMFNLVYDADMYKIDLAYVKFIEGSTIDKAAGTGVKSEDDAQAYSVKVPVKSGDITVTPAVLYYVGEKNITDAAGTVEGDKVTLTMPALGVKAKFGEITVDADFQYIMGEAKSAAGTVDVAAYAAYVNAGYKASDALKLNFFGLYSTGDDAAAEYTAFSGACMDEIEVGPLFIINDGGFINSVGISNEFDKTVSEGLTVFGLAAEYKMDKITLLGQIAYATTSTDEVNKLTVLGTEIDFRASYEVAPKTSLWVEAATILAGDYIDAAGAGQDPMYYAAGLMTNF